MLLFCAGLVLFGLLSGIEGQGNNPCGTFNDGNGRLAGFSCDYYIQCANGTAITMACAGGGAYDETTQECSLFSIDIPDCQGQTGVCEWEVIPDNCSQFRYCDSNGELVGGECGVGTVLDLRVRNCVWPDQTLLDNQGCFGYNEINQ